MEEAEEAEINAPAVVEEAVEAAVAVEEIVPPRNPIKDRPVDLDDVTLAAAVVIKDVVAVEEDAEVVDAEEVEEGVVAVEVDGERMKSRNQPPQRN